MGYELKIFKIYGDMNEIELSKAKEALKTASKIEILKSCGDKGNKYIKIFVFTKKEDTYVQEEK